ncbi:hypothetical protein [Mesorhizobium sp.]|uniref:hypothetical protein n=1 Tax=Mesorhizobium sp. TaxID=1871066 RepID=UPI000FE775A8|nr:hypothetical protein [Mesorhizobium sp.]RWA74289.1 MAG: hypothetical protein EOQ29_01265 [Mesorhizobium sp.]
MATVRGAEEMAQTIRFAIFVLSACCAGLAFLTLHSFWAWAAPITIVIAGSLLANMLSVGWSRPRKNSTIWKTACATHRRKPLLQTCNSVLRRKTLGCTEESFETAIRSALCIA